MNTISTTFYPMIQAATKSSTNALAELRNIEHMEDLAMIIPNALKWLEQAHLQQWSSLLTYSYEVCNYINFVAPLQVAAMWMYSGSREAIENSEQIKSDIENNLDWANYTRPDTQIVHEILGAGYLNMIGQQGPVLPLTEAVLGYYQHLTRNTPVNHAHFRLTNRVPSLNIEQFRQAIETAYANAGLQISQDLLDRVTSRISIVGFFSGINVVDRQRMIKEACNKATASSFKPSEIKKLIADKLVEQIADFKQVSFKFHKDIRVDIKAIVHGMLQPVQIRLRQSIFETLGKISLTAVAFEGTYLIAHHEWHLADFGKIAQATGLTQLFDPQTVVGYVVTEAVVNIGSVLTASLGIFYVFRFIDAFMRISENAIPMNSTMTADEMKKAYVRAERARWDVAISLGHVAFYGAVLYSGSVFVICGFGVAAKVAKIAKTLYAPSAVSF